ncbi:hypothetical protein TrRE_jg13400, partial [Triparma retinervis]
SGPPTSKLTFLTNGGLDSVLHLLRLGGSPPLLHQSVRLLHLLCATLDAVVPVLVESNGLVPLLVSLLAWCVRCDGTRGGRTFPKGPAREDLLVEVCRCMFAVGKRFPRYLEGGTGERYEALTQLGVLVVDCLNWEGERTRRGKGEIVKLLMVMPGSFAPFLAANGCVGRLIEHMEWGMEREC